MKQPKQFKTKHRVKFSQLDPYRHMGTEHYTAYFVDHRMNGLRENLGWDLKTLMKLPFAIYVKRTEVDYKRPVAGDQEITIVSQVREFSGADAFIECTMFGEDGSVASTCLMVAACVDSKTGVSMKWPDDVKDLFYS